MELLKRSIVMPFGSIVAGLAMRDSDVDCFVMLPNPSLIHNRTIFEAKTVLDKYPETFVRSTPVNVAIVPHVRFTHETGLQCDVSFQSPAAFRNTELVRFLLQLDSRVSDLTLIVKYWAKLHRPVGARRIMPNYAMISLVIFYLQQIKALPPIALLQENAKAVMVENWNTGFNKVPYRTANNDTLLELVGGFFKFYEEFDFEKFIVSGFTGEAIKRTIFEAIDRVPDAFDLYKRNVASDVCRPLSTGTPICLQDFFNHSSNIAASTSPEVLAQFKSDLKFAAEAFTKAGDNYLIAILKNSEYLNVLEKINIRPDRFSNISSHTSCKPTDFV